MNKKNTKHKAIETESVFKKNYRWVFASLIGLFLVALVIAGVRMQKKEAAARIDPVIIARAIMNNDTQYILVDVRSPEEYMQGHIRTAVNIPAYSSLKNWKGSIEKKDNFVRALQKIKVSEKAIVVYGHFGSSSLPGEVVRLLEEHGMTSAQLTVGWNEFAHMSAQWMPEALWRDIQVEKLIVK